MKNRLFLVFALLALLLIPSWAVAAASVPGEEPVNLVIEGQTVEPDVPPVIQNDRTLVPIRVIAEGLGAEIDWNQETRTATIERNQQKLVLTLNSATAVLNGKAVKLDAPPTVRNQRMLLPLRFVGEALGSTVGWDSTTRTVIANETVSVHINGRDMGRSIKMYKLSDKLYAPIQLIAEQVGIKGHTLQKTRDVVMIDSQQTVPIDQLKEELGGDVSWDKQDNRVEIERLNQFLGVEQEEDHLLIQTSLRVTVESFTLEGPHRIVLDLPQTVVSDELLAEQNEGTDAVSSEDEDGEDNHDEEPAEEEQTEQQEMEAKTTPLITGVRFSQYSSSPQTVRVVIELSQKSKYNLKYTDEGIVVQLNPVPRKTGFLVVVDAGHGGKDQGAKGVTGNLEKDYNLLVAKRVIELLKQYPEFQVEATRTTDVYITLQDRVKKANELDADLFISIHANSFKPQSRGTETFYYNANSKAFAQVVHRHLLAATQFPDRKVQTAEFYVIKHTKMPAVLTETGFMSNAYENAQLTSPAFREKVARALVAAIREYYQSYH
ncbi:N-acetylmuramoyl-L-alanine amidase [Brevibacillus sp. H7]|uniref:N-acetylmuramoyl-L-alanine amidase n=1 Tax=Brevibacillus sp. H7 TaxID=3349138 RepID=UPI00380E668B